MCGGIKKQNLWCFSLLGGTAAPECPSMGLEVQVQSMLGCYASLSQEKLLNQRLWRHKLAHTNMQAWKTVQLVLKLICKLILSGRLSDVRLPPTAFLHNGTGRHLRCAVHQGEGEAAGSKQSLPRLNINTRLPLTESSPPCRLPSPPWGDATQHSTQTHTHKKTLGHDTEVRTKHMHRNEALDEAFSTL